MISTQRTAWGVVTSTLLLCTVVSGALALQNTQTELAWEQVRPGLLYAKQDLTIEGSEAVHRLHWLRLDLAQDDLYLSLTPQACAGLQMPALDREPIVASLNASFFTRDFATRGHTVSAGAAWPGTLQVLESPLLACTANRQCQVLHQVPPVPSEQWRDAASGVHSLVTGGVPRTAAEDTLCGSFCTATHPRSAIGLNGTGRWMVWVAGEGRQKFVTGLPLAKLATLMSLQGVSDAVNFDGGGSTALHIEAKARTQRPDNEPGARRVANAWVISSTPNLDWKALCPSPKQEPK